MKSCTMGFLPAAFVPSSARPSVVTAAVSLLSLSALVQASPTGSNNGAGGSSKSCESFKIPVTVTSTNLIYAPPHFQTDFDVVDFVGTISSRSAPPPSVLFAGEVNQTAAYTISATFCKPGGGSGSSSGPAKNTVLIATHGLNFDRS